MEHRPFHIATPVTDLDKARYFYVKVLGAAEARSTLDWVDFDLWGNSVSCYLHPGEANRDIPTNHVDVTDAPKHIPVRHFGIILHKNEWETLVKDLQGKGIEFTIGPLIRFKGRNGEQGTIYMNDGCGNVVEFKYYKDPTTMFTPFEDDYR
jgi:extradiol dioxygenase family protein|tara:strand:- start:7059 stop:7511 length:453 start_codon:yes stop_codon:yes gene_type:complete